MRRFVLLGLMLVLLAAPWGKAGPISVDFRGANLEDAFQTVGRLGGLSVMVEDGVGGKITLELGEMEALDIIELMAMQSGLEIQVMEDVVFVGSTSWLAAMEPESQQIFNLQHVSAGWMREALSVVVERERILTSPTGEFLLIKGRAGELARVRQLVEHLDQPSPSEEGQEITAVYRLDYVGVDKAGELAALIAPNSRVQVDAASRSLVMVGRSGEQERFRAFLEDFDRPLAQVLVEVRVQEMSVNALQELGVDWGELPPLMGKTGAHWLTLDWDPTKLKGVLKALSDEGRAKLLANPQIAALEGRKARIFIGDRLPVILRGGGEDSPERIEYIEAGIILEFVPTVAADGYITLDVRPQVSSITNLIDNKYPQVRTREAQTTLRVRNGQAIVMAGLIREEEKHSLVGIPILAKLPILGVLFGQTRTETIQTEMVIFLIPHIVKEGEGIDGVSARPYHRQLLECGDLSSTAKVVPG